MKYKRKLQEIANPRWMVGMLLCMVGIQTGLAQLHGRIETEGKVSVTGQTPFWLVNNRQGLATLEKENAYLRVGLFREMQDSTKWDYRFGFDVVEAWNYPSQFVVQQAYCDVRYKWLVLSMGSKERWGMLKNRALSSGGMSLSGNARPIPQVSLETPGFVTFPWLLHNRLKVDGGIAYGEMTDEAFVKRQLGRSDDPVLYHRKSLILQYDFKDSPWSAALGLETHAQFGGDQRSLKYYWMVFIPQSGDENSPIYDQMYTFGSTHGSWHLCLIWRRKEGVWRLYLENFFEDSSGIVKKNRMDGLWGLEYTSEKEGAGVTGVTLEYLQTTDQGGPMHQWLFRDILPGPHYNVYGNDNYYLSAYNSGWSHWGLVGGNPLITSPIYGKNGVTGIFNSRVKAFHAGVSWNFSRVWRGRLLGTYTRGWGTYGAPFDAVSEDYLSLLEVSYAPRKLKGWQFTLSGAMDRGDLYGNNSGGSLKVGFGF